MRDESFRAVVNRLIHRHINNVRGDGGREDKVAEALLLEHRAGELSAVHHAVHVDFHESVVAIQALLEEGLGISGPGIGDEDIDLAKVFDDLAHGFLDGGRGCDVNAVGFGLDVVLFGEGVGALHGERVGVVPEGDVAACFGHGVDDGAANAFCGARDDDDFTRHVELLEDVGGRVRHGLGEPRPRGLAFFYGHGHCGG